MCPNCLRNGHFLIECPELPDTDELEREMESDSTVVLENDPPVPEFLKSD